jgi:hypothetical protein
MLNIVDSKALDIPDLSFVSTIPMHVLMDRTFVSRTSFTWPQRSSNESRSIPVKFNNIVISPGARCCPGHIYDDNFNEEAVHNITDLNTETLFKKTEIYKLIQNRPVVNVITQEICRSIIAYYFSMYLKEKTLDHDQMQTRTTIAVIDHNWFENKGEKFEVTISPSKVCSLTLL